jgi:hypothetical protein
MALTIAASSLYVIVTDTNFHNWPFFIVSNNQRLSYFYCMIEANELRPGNYLLQKVNNKISMVKCSFQHFEMLSKGDSASLYPVVLNPGLLERCGFRENKDYALYPEAREFILLLPVIGDNKNELYAYVKSNKECFGRATVNGAVASNNFYQLHQLQNLYFALTGRELEMK